MRNSPTEKRDNLDPILFMTDKKAMHTSIYRNWTKSQNIMTQISLVNVERKMFVKMTKRISKAV